MLLYAEKRGRFIPCRGGGTDTTYYTDQHDVDEDKVTTVYQSGHWNSWNESEAAGLMCRDLFDSPTEAWDYVASRLIYLS